MNVLAVVIAIGVGADDTFILSRVWSQKQVKCAIFQNKKDTTLPAEFVPAAPRQAGGVSGRHAAPRPALDAGHLRHHGRGLPRLPRLQRHRHQVLQVSSGADNEGPRIFHCALIRLLLDWL